MNPTIGLLWHTLRSANLGWGAMSISHLAMLKHAADILNRHVSIRIIDMFDGPLRYSPAGITPDEVVIGMEVLQQGKDTLTSAVYAAISGCDVVMDFAGGDIFSDIYGERVFSFVVDSRLAVLALRKRLILSPQTIGPFKTDSTQSRAAEVVRGCEKVFTRDSWSSQLLEQMGLRAEESMDLAFRLPFIPRMPGRSARIQLGLNVSGLLYYVAQSGENSFDLSIDYRLLIDRIIETFAHQPNISVVLIPHVIGGRHKSNDDVWICKALADRFSLAIAPTFTSPSEAKSFISGLDILVGSRMHATIAGVSSGVPTIPLAYSPKFRGVFESLNYPFVCDLASEDIDGVIENIQSAIGRLSEIHTAAIASNAVAQSKLNRYQQYLVEVVQSLP